jgi:hypothetical protein
MQETRILNFEFTFCLEILDYSEIQRVNQQLIEYFHRLPAEFQKRDVSEGKTK